MGERHNDGPMNPSGAQVKPCVGYQRRGVEIVKAEVWSEPNRKLVRKFRKYWRYKTPRFRSRVFFAPGDRLKKSGLRVEVVAQYHGAVQREFHITWTVLFKIEPGTTGEKGRARDLRCWNRDDTLRVGLRRPSCRRSTQPGPDMRRLS